MIDTTKTIDHLYSALCIEGRQLSLSKEAMGWICTNCDRPEREHYHGKCTNYATSLPFRADETNRMEFVSAALSLLEQIKELRP